MRGLEDETVNKHLDISHELVLLQGIDEPIQAEIFGVAVISYVVKRWGGLFLSLLARTPQVFLFFFVVFCAVLRINAVEKAFVYSLLGIPTLLPC